MDFCRVKIWFLLLAFQYMSTIAYSQQEQVAFIPGVFEITAIQRNQKQILEQYADGFKRAILLREANGEYFVKVDYQKRGKAWFEVYSISAEELQSLRNALSGGTTLPKTQSESTTAYNGRYYLITSSTAHSIVQGLFLSQSMTREVTHYSPWGNYTYDEKTRFGEAFPFLVGAGVFTTSLFVTKDRPILASAANLHFFGSSFGYVHGMALGALASGDISLGDNRMALYTGLTSLVEGWSLYYLAKKHNFDYARSVAWNSGNFWGGVQGSMLHNVVFGTEDMNARAIGGSILLGSAGGILLYNHLQKSLPRTTGDHRAINAAGLIGSVVGLGFNTDQTSRMRSGLFMMSSGAFLAAGYGLTKFTSFDNAEGALITVGSAAGGLAGIGISIAFDSNSDSAPFFYTATGAAIGWTVSYLFFKNRNHSPVNRGMGLETKRKSKVDFNFNPVGFGMMNQSEEQQIRMLQQNISGDMLGFKLTF